MLNIGYQQKGLEDIQNYHFKGWLQTFNALKTSYSCHIMFFSASNALIKVSSICHWKSPKYKSFTISSRTFVQKFFMQFI